MHFASDNKKTNETEWYNTHPKFLVSWARHYEWVFMAGLIKRKKIAIIGPMCDGVDRIQRTQSYAVELTSSNCSVS